MIEDHCIEGIMEDSDDNESYKSDNTKASHNLLTFLIPSGGGVIIIYVSSCWTNQFVPILALSCSANIWSMSMNCP